MSSSVDTIFIDTDNEVECKKQFNIYRFKFNDNIILILKEFAKLHQFDDRITFKEAWTEWIKLYNSEIEEERKRLEAIGYTSDVIIKMFKSTRYYFKKKLTIKKEEINEELNEDQHSDQIEKSNNRTYISLDIGLLEEIDSHIKKNSNNDTYTPALGWDEFCVTYNNLVESEINRINREYNLDKQNINNKLKKAYKNKYYHYTHRL